jgi:YbgC/YbaW family acyl-CoA thioester hydrolase
MHPTFSLTHRVAFPETDLAGVVHFSNYFKWMEEVEHAFFRSVGLSVSMQHDGMHVGWPRVKATCEFTGPVRFEDLVDCRLTVTRIGKKSFTYEVVFLVNDHPVGSGSITSVCCKMTTPGGLEPIEIPPAIRGKLTAH